MNNDILLHISPNQYPPLQEDHHTKKIWKELAEGTKEYHVFARSKGNRFENYSEGNLHLHLIPAITEKQWSFVFSSWIMIYYILKYRVNKMLVQCPINGGFTACVYSKILGIPYMVEIHGEEYFRYFEKKKFIDKILDKIQRITFNNAKIIRSLSHKMTEKLKLNGIRNNIVEIPNRVNISLFNKVKENYTISAPVKIVSVGRFVEAKNYEFLIDFCIENGYELTLIGGGHLFDKYQERIGAHKNINLIQWLNQSEFIDIVVNSDIYIQSSVTEGVPRTIIEAMAMRMPIVATKVGSIEGILIDEENSILINNPLDKEEYKNKIEKITQNEELREKIARNAHSDAVNKYEWSKAFKIYKQAIRDL